MHAPTRNLSATRQAVIQGIEAKGSADALCSSLRSHSCHLGLVDAIALTSDKHPSGEVSAAWMQADA
jgi:hypothetical protein